MDYLSIQLGIFIIPTEEVHHFSEGLVGQPPTRNRCEIHGIDGGSTLHPSSIENPMDLGRQLRTYDVYLQQTWNRETWTYRKKIIFRIAN